MRTLWAAPKPKASAPATGPVTREELPGLVRRIVAEIVTGVMLGTVERILPTTAQAEAAPVKVKRPRAPGHCHRGVCGPKCFSGKRGPK